MSLDERVRRRLLELLGSESIPPTEVRGRLQEALRLLAKHRSHLIQNTLVKLEGVTVRGGPFAGMTFREDSTEGCHVPKLLGCYESELHPWVEAIVARGYSAIIDVGCAEGYYAIGLAGRCPMTRVDAFDTAPDARASCQSLAEANGVGDRVRVGDLFRGNDLGGYPAGETLLLLDIEGDEEELIAACSPEALAGCDLLIECHDALRAGISDRLRERLSATHATAMVPHRLAGSPIDLPAFFGPLGHLDALLATWEWRSGPTPWLIALSRLDPERDDAMTRLLRQSDHAG